METSAGKGAALAEALLKVIGDNSRGTVDSLARLLAARASGSKRNADRMVSDAKRDLLDACAVEAQVPNGKGGGDTVLLCEAWSTLASSLR